VCKVHDIPVHLTRRFAADIDAKCFDQLGKCVWLISQVLQSKGLAKSVGNLVAELGHVLLDIGLGIGGCRRVCSLCVVLIQLCIVRVG